MKKSQSRILTTHAGSLPRPLALTDLYAKRAKGQSIDDAAIATLVSTAVSQIVPKQIEAGLDVVNRISQGDEIQSVTVLNKRDHEYSVVKL